MIRSHAQVEYSRRATEKGIVRCARGAVLRRGYRRDTISAITRSSHPDVIPPESRGEISPVATGLPSERREKGGEKIFGMRPARTPLRAARCTPVPEEPFFRTCVFFSQRVKTVLLCMYVVLVDYLPALYNDWLISLLINKIKVNKKYIFLLRPKMYIIILLLIF